MKPLYQIVFLGANDGRTDEAKALIGRRLLDLGLEKEVVVFYGEPQAKDRDPRLPVVAVFYGYHGATDNAHPIINSLLEDSTIIIPVVADLSHVTEQIPPKLTHINALALQDGAARLVSLIFESFRLLRKERRLFISYKRKDSQHIASQLYEALDSRGFDVFIDTRSVPPAADFQSILWHGLSDSDVVVLLDTAGFRDSRWTTEELRRANATNIQILHLLWPGQVADAKSALSHFRVLGSADFEGQGSGQEVLTASAATDVCVIAESLRARAIAARHRYLVDSFCDAARDLGLEPAVEAERWISLNIKGMDFAVVPTIGIPTSDRVNEVVEAISRQNPHSRTWILYDNRGLLPEWMQHLAWLNQYLPIQSVSAAFAPAALVEVIG